MEALAHDLRQQEAKDDSVSHITPAILCPAGVSSGFHQAAAKRNNIDNDLERFYDTMLTPEEIVAVLEDGLASDTFYIMG